MKSAQQKWAEYLEECAETGNALTAFERAVQDKYDNHGYAYIAGYMMMQFREVVAELPKADVRRSVSVSCVRPRSSSRRTS